MNCQVIYYLNGLSYILLRSPDQSPNSETRNPKVLKIVVDPEIKRIVMVIWVVEFPWEGYKIDSSSLFDINQYHESASYVKLLLLKFRFSKKARF